MPSFEDGQIHVDYAHMDNGADDLIQQTKAIDQTLTNLDAELGALREYWSGQDKQAYTVCQTKWNGAVNAMERLLADYSQLLTDASGTYHYTEQSLAQLWEGIKVQG
ncbi:WXG100 family type VII secretion target [Streptomyces violaceorubidus]|uniref:WXG100 family type VII secretion target n=1 Tax=Streptomyces violaceorubidus TaxID=284042 RepID=UPI0004C1987E|nr:WXG100 family type VII secretion target [Streptomyces violaceorubidus]